MRSARPWIGWVAMFSVLLHAAYIVRHNAYALNSQWLKSELTAALGVICHSDGTPAQRDADNQPVVPADPNSCPICMGMAAVAVLPQHEAPKAAQICGMVEQSVPAAPVFRRHAVLVPPPRGPPVIS